MTPNTDDVAVKVKKLLELANKGNTTEAEANLALERVQKLLAQYNLSMAQVEAVSLDKNVTEAIDAPKRTDEKHTRGAMYEYQQNLWATIASVNFCWHFTVPVYKEYEDRDGNIRHRKVSNNHRLVGREINVTAAKLMGDYLEQTINRLCPWQGKECLSRSAISWKEGCASRLRVRLIERFDKLKEESRKAAVDPQALVLANVVDSEWEANWAFLYGQESLQKMKARRAAARAVVDAPAEKAETNAQRKKREAREKREQERAARKREKYWERRDLNAWYEGRQKADEVNLDPQIQESKGERSLE